MFFVFSQDRWSMVFAHDLYTNPLARPQPRRQGSLPIPVADQKDRGLWERDWQDHC